MKTFLQKVLFLASGTAFILLGTYVSITGIGLQLLLLVLFYVMMMPKLWSGEACFDHRGCKKRHIVSALLICVLIWASFYFLWRDSAKGQQVLQVLLGARHDQTFLWITVIGAVLALPFMITICQWISDKTETASSRWIKFISGKLWLICVFVSVIGILLQICSIFSRETWVDEAFSLAMIKHSYTEMIELTARDVHPPLYYIILKAGVEAGTGIGKDIPAIYIAKLISFLPYGILLFLCFTKVRRRWGLEVMGIWAVCTVSMPRMILYGVEIRMYSYALLFVTTAFLCMDNMMVDGRIRDWVLFTAMALAAAYTHYFALAAAAVLYFLLFVHFIRKRQTKQLIWTVISGLTAAIGYLPWLIIFMKQLQRVGGDYWIPQITAGTIAGYVYFVFGNGVLFALCMLIMIRLMSELRSRKTDDLREILALSGISVPVMTAFTGVAASLLIRPVFIPRYLVPGLACLWLGIALGLSALKNEKFRTVVTLFFLVVCLTDMGEFARNEFIGKVQAEELEDVLAKNREAIFVTGSEYAQAVIAEKGAAETYLWGKDVDELSADVYGDNIDDVKSLDEIEQWIRSGRTVYFLETDGFISVQELVQGSNLHYTDSGSYKAEKATVFYQLK